MRISCASEVLSVRIQQENPRRVHRPDEHDRLFKGEILSGDAFSLSTSCLPMLAAATNCCRISPKTDGESVCLPFLLFRLDTRRITITSVNTTGYSTLRDLLASFVFSSYVQLLFGYRSDRLTAKCSCMYQ